MQIIVNKTDKKVIATSFGKGKKHDFKLFKQSKTFIKEKIKIEADRGYQGIKKIHSNSNTPVKKLKNKPLSKENIEFNKKLASSRILVEHVIGRLKVFRILSERYRNRRKRFNLRFNLIAGFYNYALTLP